MDHLPAPRSLWNADTALPDRSGSLPGKTEVLVIGAGIAGLTSACLLARSGRTVTVLEARRVGGGVTGNTTAKVTAQHSLVYDHLSRTHGKQVATGYGQAQLDALEWIATEAATHDVDCSFERRDSFVYSRRPERREELVKEADAAQAAGMPAEYVSELDLPFDVAGAVRFREQAQFHPLRWLLHLASEVEQHGGAIVEGVRVMNAHRRGDVFDVETDRGSLRAGHVVVATHYPILDRGMFFSRLDPTRDLVVHGPVATSNAPSGMYLCADDGHSIRTVPGMDPSQPELIIGGEHYRPGEAVDVEGRYTRLAGWAKDTFAMESVTHRWSAHDLTTIDRIPYVGRYAPGSSNLWVATGFALWGMTNGTVAGRLLQQLVLGGADKARSSLFDPQRGQLRGIPAFAKANAAVALHLVGDLARAAVNPADFDALPRDSATVARQRGDVVAAYRDTGGSLHLLSAHCTHLGCTVQFNNAERSWDCPCHASRFDIDGAVLNGPATEPLRRIGARTPQAHDLPADGSTD